MSDVKDKNEDKNDGLDYCFEQYELRFDHYISDNKTGKKMRLEEPIIIRSVVSAMARKYDCNPVYVKNEILNRLCWEMRNRMESED